MIIHSFFIVAYIGATVTRGGLLGRRTTLLLAEAVAAESDSMVHDDRVKFQVSLVISTNQMSNLTGGRLSSSWLTPGAAIMDCRYCNSIFRAMWTIKIQILKIFKCDYVESCQRGIIGRQSTPISDEDGRQPPRGIGLVHAKKKWSLIFVL